MNWLYITGRIDEDLLNQVALKLRKRGKKDETNVVLRSYGGYIEPAYKIVNLLWHYSKNVQVYILDYAKSAATFICLGCSKVYMSEVGELGAIDPQIRHAKGESIEHFSVLSHQRAVKVCIDIASDFLIDHYRIISSLQGTIPLNKRLSLATEYASRAVRPLLEQIEPVRIAEYQNFASEIIFYFKLLIDKYNLRQYNNNLLAIVKGLVYDIPSHSFVVDYMHLKGLGLNVELIKESTRQEIEHMIMNCVKDNKDGHNTVALLDNNIQGGKNGKEE